MLQSILNATTDDWIAAAAPHITQLTTTMAGLGRRSHYRKHLTDAVLHDFPEPQENECIAKVVATRGGNQFDVLVAANGSTFSSFSKTPQLAILPNKFHKLIWVKRGDYCIVQTGNENEDTKDATTSSGGGVRYIITHILYKEQIKHLKAKKLWPTDKEFQTLEGADRRQHIEEEAKWTSGEEEDDDNEEQDGIVYDTGIDDEFFINTNRVNAMQIQDSESETSDEEGDIRQQETDDDGIVYDTGDDDLFANTNRVAALRIEDSESESSKDENDIHQQETDDIEYDTGNREAALQVQGATSVESWNNQDDDDEIQQQKTDDVEYDTGNILQEEEEVDLANDTSADEHEDADDDSKSEESRDIGQTETNDVEYDTGNILQEEEADGDLVYDTKRGADGLVVEPDRSSEFDSSDDEESEEENQETENGIV